jgi:hypothetical protein
VRPRGLRPFSTHKGFCFVADHAVRIEPPHYRANSGSRMLSRRTPLGEQVLRESPERIGIPVERTVQRVGGCEPAPIAWTVFLCYSRFFAIH